MLLRRETKLHFTLYITCINQTINTIQYPLAYKMDTAKKTYMCILLGRAQ